MVLIDPNGELADVGSNLTFDSTGTLSPGLNAQLFDADPLAGRWHLVVVVQNPVSGAEISQAFHGTVSFDNLQTQATGLPNSASKVLKAGQPVTATVLVRNTGVQAIAVGADPRLNKVQTLQPVPIQGSLTFPLPSDGTDPPVYIIPPDTSSLTVAASSTLPAQVELQGSAAGFDIFGDLQAAKEGSTVSTATVFEKSGFISKGIWFTSVSELGPFTDAGAPAGQTTITASMRTAGFDPAVTSSTDDPFRIAIDPTLRRLRQPSAHSAGSGRNHPGDDHASGQERQRIRGHLNIVTPSTLPTGPQTGLPVLHDRCGDQHAAVHLHDRLVGSLDLAGSTNGCVPPPRQSRAHGPGRRGPHY